MQKITPSLWFDFNAQEAIDFYSSVFKDTKIKTKTYYPEGAPAPKGTLMTIEFELLGMEFLAINGGNHFSFNPAVSFVVNCETQQEVDYYWDKLLQGGKAMQCGWLQDKYGLSWQITPIELLKMWEDKDEAKRARVMQAMCSMVKLDLAALKKAYAG